MSEPPDFDRIARLMVESLDPTDAAEAKSAIAEALRCIWNARASEPAGELLSITQAAARVGVTRRTIYNWIAAGKLTTVRTTGGRPRIVADTLWRAPEPRLPFAASEPNGKAAEP